MRTSLSRRRVVTSCAVAAMAVGVVGVGTALGRLPHLAAQASPWPVPSPTARAPPPRQRPPRRLLLRPPRRIPTRPRHPRTRPRRRPPRPRRPPRRPRRPRERCRSRRASSSPTTWPSQRDVQRRPLRRRRPDRLPGPARQVAHAHVLRQHLDRCREHPLQPSAASPSSCGRGMGTSDLSAYWVPSLIKTNADGSKLRVQGRADEHRATTGEPAAERDRECCPFPVGLRMIAGDAWRHRTSRCRSFSGTAAAEASRARTCTSAREPHRRRSTRRSSSPAAGTASIWTVRITSRTWPTRAGRHLPRRPPRLASQITFEVDFPGSPGGPLLPGQRRHLLVAR